MSIKERMDKSKPITAIPGEEEFEIVGNGGVAQTGIDWKKHAFVGLVIVLIAGISFGIGRLISYEDTKPSVTIGEDALPVPSEPSAAVLATKPLSPAPVSPQAPPKVSVPATPALSSGPIVASKNGTKYYLTTCSGAKRISDANKIYFASEDDARAAGLTPSSTCKGLK